METYIAMTEEKFQEIYTDKKLRNAVAFAHECWSASPNSHFLHKGTCTYPVRYKVTEEQIEKAKKLLSAAKVVTKERYKNSLLFIGMGMTYDTKSDIGNHRIRTEFLNKEGRRFFVEFGTAVNHDFMRCNSSIEYVGKEEKHNFGNLERQIYSDGICRYTPKEVLELVNRVYDCKFTEIFIDNYDLSCDGIMCESPKESPHSNRPAGVSGNGLK